MGKVLERASAGRVEVDVVQKLLAMAEEHEVPVTTSTFEICLALMLGSKNISGAESIIDTMEGLNAVVSAQAKVTLVRLKNVGKRHAVPEDRDSEDLPDPIMPEEAEALADFVLTAIGTGRFECISYVTSRMLRVWLLCGISKRISNTTHDGVLFLSSHAGLNWREKGGCKCILCTAACALRSGSYV